LKEAGKVIKLPLAQICKQPRKGKIIQSGNCFRLCVRFEALQENLLSIEVDFARYMKKIIFGIVDLV